jgi:hypothetical protein
MYSYCWSRFKSLTLKKSKRSYILGQREYFFLLQFFDRNDNLRYVWILSKHYHVAAAFLQINLTYIFVYILMVVT